MTSYKFNPSILREYDVRGVYGESLTTEDAKMLGISFGTRVMESGGKIIVVGFDGRITSPELCNSLDILLVQTSTHAVFDGKKHTAYCEDDIPNPINISYFVAL